MTGPALVPADALSEELTFLLDDAGRPTHKACAETELDQAVPS